jgi:hypothetical protein
MEAMVICFARVLDVVLKRKQGCPEAVVGAVALSVTRALEYLRDKQVLHCRLKKMIKSRMNIKKNKKCDI